MDNGRLALDRGLPSNVDAERFVLGSILLNDSLYIQAAGNLQSDDFSLEKHRRIFVRMGELAARNERIDRVTLANELMRFNELESVDGLSYIVSLDDGLPQVLNIDSYLGIVKEKALKRQIIFASQHLMNRALIDEEDSAAILRGAGETFLTLSAEDKRKAGLMSTAEIIDNYQGGLNVFLDPTKRVKGIGTGFTKLDEKTSGLHKGDLFVLAARPSMGKTALALNIAQHVALKSKLSVAMFSLEMSRESLLTRMMCASARVDSQKFRAGYLSADERKRLQAAASAMADAPFYVDDTAGASPMEVHAKCRRHCAENGGLDLVIMDYLQLMQGSRRAESRQQEVSTMSREMKLLAKDLGVPMILLSQLNRAPETRAGDHRPQLSDLRESGAIEQDADVVAFIFREEVYRPQDESLRGQAELILAKQRNGPVGKIELVFLHEFTKFENRAADLDFEEAS
jgi:replicative DNA helicase